MRIKPEVTVRVKKQGVLIERTKSYLAADDCLEIHEWQVQAINDGIAAADRGNTISFEEIKKIGKYV